MANTIVIQKPATGSAAYMVSARVEVPFLAAANSLVACAISAVEPTPAFASLDAAAGRVVPTTSGDAATINLPLIGTYTATSPAAAVTFILSCRTNGPDNRILSSAHITILGVDSVQ